MAEIRVGFSGWTYAPWRGIFYPKKHPIKRELEYASRQVGSIEINGTFYRLQQPKSFQSWYDDTPPDFRFAVKANNFVTHRRRLKDVEQPLANFFASGLLLLKEKLGPLLWQLPPNLPMVDDRFETFFKLLPHNSREAAALAARHDSFVAGRAVIDPGGDYPIRHAFEFRHSSFNDEDFIELMRKYNVACVFPDSGEHDPGIRTVTADHVYVRMHGQAPEYAETGYTEEALDAIAEKILAWAKTTQLVSVYFDNDAKALAPLNAMRLSQKLGLRE